MHGRREAGRRHVDLDNLDEIRRKANEVLRRQIIDDGYVFDKNPEWVRERHQRYLYKRGR